jgi:6-phosphogluconolactonase/glucosamine-6-phosphate isomerase/deaminase
LDSVAFENFGDGALLRRPSLTALYSSDCWLTLLRHLRAVLCTTAPEFPTERISCSKGMLKQAKYAALMITGSEKETLFNESKESGLPVGYLQREFSQLTVFYAP